MSRVFCAARFHLRASLPMRLLWYSASLNRPVSSLEHLKGRRVFLEMLNNFELCQIVLDYVQNILPGGGENSSRGSSPRWSRACLWNVVNIHARRINMSFHMRCLCSICAVTLKDRIKKIKSYLCSTMGESQLSAVAILSIESKFR